MWEWMTKNIFCENGSWFWSMAQFFAITISLIFIYSQVRVQRQANLLQTLCNFDVRWDSNQMQKSRRKACEEYSTNQLNINRVQSDVIGFFEDIGLYLERGVFDANSIWDKYSYYIELYWAIYQPHIMEFRETTEDSTWYENFEKLSKKMKDVSKKKGIKTADKTKEEIQSFVDSEKV